MIAKKNLLYCNNLAESSLQFSLQNLLLSNHPAKKLFAKPFSFFSHFANINTLLCNNLTFSFFAVLFAEYKVKIMKSFNHKDNRSDNCFPKMGFKWK